MCLSEERGHWGCERNLVILKLLFSNSVIYSLSNMLQRGLTVVLLPLYTSYLGMSEFGAMDLLYQLVLTLALITSFGLPHGLKRGIYLDTTTADDQSKLLGAMLVLLLPVTLLVAGVLWLSGEQISMALFLTPEHASWIHLSVFFYVAMSLQQVYIQVLRTNQEARRLAFWSIVTVLIIAAWSVLLLMYFGLGLSGIIIANIIGFGVTGLILAAAFTKHVRLNLEFSRLAPLFAFGLPMMPALLSRKVLEVSDRYMIPHYHSLNELAIYVMGNKIALIFDVAILVPFLYAWQPFFYSQAGNKEAPQLFAAITHYMFMILCLAFLLLIASQYWLLALLGSGRYSQAGPVIFWLLVSKMFVGIQYLISTGIHIKKKLVQELLVMFCAAVLNIVLNLLLIPPYKGLGAAVATALSFMFLFAVTFAIAQRHYPVPYRWARMANVLVQTIAAFGLMAVFSSLAVKYLILCVYVFSCAYLDLRRHGDMKRILEMRPRMI